MANSSRYDSVLRGLAERLIDASDTETRADARHNVESLLRSRLLPVLEAAEAAKSVLTEEMFTTSDELIARCKEVGEALRSALADLRGKQ